ncbi:DUF559 domain-containing protein [Pseudarthrobacter sp. J1763]|uniref:DUF559 domain-containing protein n=1 Tax=Pseudarthrobacter sp. J1763 TaxID=3420445 RepID=UPI003D2CA297
MDIADYTARLGGIAHSRQYQKLGFSRRAIAEATAQGLVQRVSAGTYSVLPASSPLHLAASHASALTCLSAAKHYGLWHLFLPQVPHLAVTGHLNDVPCVQHRTAGSLRGLTPPVLALKDVLLDALLCLSELEALVMVESACTRGDSSPGFLMRHLQGPRTGKARGILDLVEGGADSLIETVARVLFRRHGFHTETQVYIDGIGYVDFLINGCLIVELDGLAFHFNERQFKKDQDRNNRAAELGFRVLRFRYQHVVYSPEFMLEQIKSTLATPAKH